MAGGGGLCAGWKFGKRILQSLLPWIGWNHYSWTGGNSSLSYGRTSSKVSANTFNPLKSCSKFSNIILAKNNGRNLQIQDDFSSGAGRII